MKMNFTPAATEPDEPARPVNPNEGTSPANEPFGNNRCVVLLGASNLTRSFPQVVDCICRVFNGRRQLFAATGNGRSYGIVSCFLGRSLPGIVDCELWNDLKHQRAADAETHLLLTDFGNDLAYGVSVAEILDWTNTCLERAAAKPSQTILTLPPLCSLSRLSPFRYFLLRTLSFPGCRIPHSKMLALTEELTAGLQEIGDSRGLHVVAPEADWYGFDPIHIRRRRRAAIWRTILSHWPDFNPPASQSPVDPATRKRLKRIRPAERRLFGRTQRTAQPTVSADDWELWLY